MYVCICMCEWDAGKTTLLRAIGGHTTAGITDGSIRINGYAIGEHASRISKIPSARFCSVTNICNDFCMSVFSHVCMSLYFSLLFFFDKYL
jgi:ABC-type branched-subunit amino acid transport system ATPase component